jgi:hypothetical protein
LIDKNYKVNYKYKILDKYQEFIRRYISPYTYYDRLLIFHSTGTGKTFAAISVAETHRRFKNKSLILVRGKTSELNFKNLIKEFYNKSNIHINKNDKYYEFGRFVTLSKKLKNLTNDEIIKEYSNKIIIIDEAHNIKSKESSDVYNMFDNMLHIVKNCKVLFLTATPMIDNSNEIFPLLNLILNKKNEITNKDYGNIEILENKINGIISYCDIKYNIPNIKIKGIILPNLKFKVYVSFMKGFQLEAWKKINKKKKNDPVHKKKIYCSTIVSSTLKYGIEMKNECINEIETKNYGKKFVLKNKIKINLDNIDKYSCKFASMLKLSELCDGCIYVFCEDIEGSGLKILSAILENIGYSIFTEWNNKIHKDKRFILCTGDESITPRVDCLIDSFCRDENKKGEYIKFFLGSKVSSESINLKNIRQVHILTPHWNLPVINQAIGRSIRNYSHNSLDEKMRNVEIFLHCAIGILDGYNISKLFNDKNVYNLSIDYYKYKCSQKKYNEVKEIKTILKSKSINKLFNNYEVKNYENIDYFTYRAFYSNSLSNHIIELIKNEVNKFNHTNLSKNSIIESFKKDKLDISNNIIDDILFKRIINKKNIKDKYLQPKKILYHDHIIYFNGYNNNEKDFSIHFANYKNIKENISIKTGYLDINNKINYNQLEISKFTEINLKFINMIFKMDIKELVEILEYGIINNIKIIKSYFSNFLILHNNTLYHNLCYFNLNDKICSYSISSGNYNISSKTRKYVENNKVFKYVKDYNLELLIKNKNKDTLKRIDKDLKIYLLISNADKCFRICNKITENTNKSKKDSRSKNRGKRIESHTPEELNIIFNYLLKKMSFVMLLNLKSNNININTKSKKNLQEIIKYLLFMNKMYLIR